MNSSEHSHGSQKPNENNELLESKELLQNIIDVSITSTCYYIAIRDDNKVIVDFEWKLMNLKSQEFSGGRNMIGKRYAEEYPGIKTSGLFEKFVKTVEENIQQDFEVHYAHDGLDRWFRIIAVRLGDGMVTSSEDITERKKQEQEILHLKDELAQHAENKYRTLFEQMVEGFTSSEVVRDGNGKICDWRFLEVNAAIEAHSGIRAADLVGRLSSEVYPNLDRWWLDIIGRILDNQQAEHFEEYTNVLDRWHVITIFPFGHERFAVLYYDITERKRREQDLAFLAEISKDLFAIRNIESAMEMLGEKIGNYFGTTWCMFAETDNFQKAVVSNGWNAREVPSIKGTYRISDFLSEMQQAANNAGKITIVADTQTDPRVNAENYRLLGIRSFIMVPLVRSSEWRFLISIAHHKPRNWRQDEIDLIKEIAERIWSRVERARTENALRLYDDRNAYLLKLSDALRPLGNVRDIQSETCRFLRTQFGAGWSYYCEFDEAYTEATVMQDSTSEGLPSLVGKHLMSDMPELVALYKSGQLVDVEDLQTSNLLSQRAKDFYKPIGIRSFLSIPVMKDGRLIAALLLADTKPRIWSRLEIDLTIESAQRTWEAIARVRAEEALRQNQAHLFGVLETLPVGVAVVDKEGNVILTNKAMDRYIPSGILPSKDNERSWRWLAFDADGSRIQPHDFPASRAMRGEETLLPGLEMLYTQDSGHQVWTRVTSIPVKDKDGNILEVTSVVTDINEMKEAFEELRISEKRLKTVVNLVPDLLWRSDKDGFATWYNEQWYKYTGQAVDESTDYGWLLLVHPQDREASIENFRKAVNEGKPLKHEERIRNKDGEYRWFLMQSNPVFNDNGEIVQWYCAATDIHERKLLEETMSAQYIVLEELVKKRTKQLQEANISLAEEHYFLEQVTDKSPHLIYVFDLREERFNYINRRVTELIGRDPDYVYAMGPHLFHAILHPKDLERRVEYVNTLAKLKPGEIRENEFRIWNGTSFRWFRSKDSIFKEEDGQVMQVLGIAEDITYEKMLDEKITDDSIQTGLN